MSDDDGRYSQSSVLTVSTQTFKQTLKVNAVASLCSRLNPANVFKLKSKTCLGLVLSQI